MKSYPPLRTGVRVRNPPRAPLLSGGDVISAGDPSDLGEGFVQAVRVRLIRPGPTGTVRSCAGTVQDFAFALSYLLSYHLIMAQRQKRSISLPSDLADAIDQAATAQGTTVSAWIAETAAHRLRIDAGRQGVAEWERQHGALTPDELADGLARARAMLRRQPSRKSA